MKTPFHKKPIQILVYLSMFLLFFGFLLLGIINYYSIITFVIFITVALICLALFVANIIAGTFSDTVEINETGVYFNLKKKSLHMDWKHIRIIAVSKYGWGKASKRVVFSSKHNKDILHLIYPYSSLSNNLLFLQNRKDLIIEIEKYWDKEILNKGNNSY